MLYIFNKIEVFLKGNFFFAFVRLFSVFNFTMMAAKTLGCLYLGYSLEELVILCYYANL